ncbi:MAG: phosphoribosylformylglycinamidine synthase subunit PurS [Terriglobales bacterium]
MRAWIHVALKPTVLDPQGKAIQAALHKLGFGAVSAVRQGKLFELTFEPGTSRAAAQEQAARAAQELLANPVIEDFSIRWEE